MNIPTNIITDIQNSTGAVMGGVMPLIVIMFGITIAFYIIKNLITLIPKG